MDGDTVERRLRLLLSVQLVNMLGDGLLTVGATLIIVSGRGAPSDLATFLVSCSLACVTSLAFASISLDSVNRRHALILIDVGRIVSAAILTAYHLRGGGVYVLFAAGLFVGFSSALYRPAFTAYLGDIADPSHLIQVNSLRSIASRISSVAGPALAGLLATLHLYAAIPVVAGILSALSLVAFLVSPEGFVPSRTGTRAVLSFAALRYIIGHRWILAVMLQGGVQIGFVTAPLSLIVPLWLGHHASAEQYGFLTATEAAGALIAGFIVIRCSERLAPFAMPALLLQGGAPLAIACNSPITLLYISYFLTGAGMSMFGILWISSIQRHVPRESVGQILAIDSFTTSALSTVGVAFAGVMVQNFSVEILAGATAIVVVISVLAALLVSGVSTLGFT
ncbi:MAG: MFS transporter [Gordonia sp. (in: high G+C Gram-positive bacteria)]